MDILERFRAKVLVKETGCHEWQSTLHRDGYGKFWFNGGQIQAHRMAYLLHRGDIPNALWVLHHCDNRKCVNPEHLYLGTAQQNSADRTKRLRYACRKLNGDAVHSIRSLYAQGSWSQQRIAALFGINQAYVSRIILRKQRVLK